MKLSVKGCDDSDGKGCADDEEVSAKQSIRLLMPESTVNYELDTEEAVTWTAKSTLALMMDPLSRKK